MRYMGIDYGAKRVGVALSDEAGTMAFAHAVLPNNRQLVTHVGKLCSDRKVGMIIVGESKNFAGNDNQIMASIRSFVENVQKEIKLPVALEPEFMTSVQASRIQGEHDTLDASAAALILQSYLDRSIHAGGAKI